MLKVLKKKDTWNLNRNVVGKKVIIAICNGFKILLKTVFTVHTICSEKKLLDSKCIDILLDVLDVLESNEVYSVCDCVPIWDYIWSSGYIFTPTRGGR